MFIVWYELWKIFFVLSVSSSLYELWKTLIAFRNFLGGPHPFSYLDMSLHTICAWYWIVEVNVK